MQTLQTTKTEAVTAGVDARMHACYKPAPRECCPLARWRALSSTGCGALTRRGDLVDGAGRGSIAHWHVDCAAAVWPAQRTRQGERAPNSCHADCQKLGAVGCILVHGAAHVRKPNRVRGVVKADAHHDADDWPFEHRARARGADPDHTTVVVHSKIGVPRRRVECHATVSAWVREGGAGPIKVIH